MSFLYTLALAGAAGLGVIWLAAQNIRVVKEYERGVVYRFGRVRESLHPSTGLAVLIPIVDRLQEGEHADHHHAGAGPAASPGTKTVRVDAVVYFKVTAPDGGGHRGRLPGRGRAGPQTSLRSVIGKSDLDDLLGDRKN